jgi:hypothetical protein
MKDLIIDFDNSFEKMGLFSILKELKGKQIIKIAKQHNKRSLKINKYYWGVVLRYISDYSGHSTAYLHEVFKEEFVPQVKFRDDFELSTADMTNIEIMAYIEKIREWAFGFDKINIPDPDGVLL